MKGKKLILLLFVVLACCLLLGMSIALAFLLSSNMLQTQRINDLEKQLLTQPIENSTSTNPEPVSTDTIEPVSNKWTINSKSDVQESSDFKIDVVYPELNNPDYLNTAKDVNNYIKSIIQNAKKGVTEIDASVSSAKPFLNLDYNVKFLNDKFVSIVLTGSSYLGGAHPTGLNLVINYDLRNNKVVELEDMFIAGSAYLTTLSVTSRAELADELGVDATDSLLVSGTTATPSNFQLFYIFGDAEADTFGIIFPEYQVAPYAAGVQKVEMNISDISEKFKADFADLLL